VTPWCWLAALALLLGLPTAATAQARFAFDDTRSVLPKSVAPSRYRLAFDVDPARERFSGQAEILLTVRQPVAQIVLHARGLEAKAGGVLLRSAGTSRAMRVRADTKASLWTLTPADGRPIAAGEHRLTVAYRGRVQRSGEGLYRADHRVEGQAATMLATQLQAIEARSLFPAFDEPLFRAVFEISVRAPRGYEVLSNMPRVASATATNSVLHRFAPTPSMPSYLVAFAVGRFDMLEGDAAGLPLRIFTAPGKREQGRYAMAQTQRLLPYFNDWFGVPYALPKLDQLAIPSSRSGAMEDWGLISYIENALLYDPARSGASTQRRVFGTVAHELAHQWFGNLVSVASWDEIWLNEAFATWMENKAAEHFYPEWQASLARRGWQERAMERDATPATRAIRSGPVNEARVFEVFDGITYSKGGAVLSMLEQWIGEPAFKRGLAAYMNERRFAPATAGDLWFHIGQAAGRPVATVSSSWTEQPGFPLLRLDARCEGGSTRIVLSQRRFLMDPNAAAAGQWQVPVRIARGGELHTLLLDAPERRFELPGCSEAALLANAGGRGFYRVQYDAASQRRLLEQFAALAAADRVALLSDRFALAQAGQAPLADYFALLAQLPAVTDAGRDPLYALAVQQLKWLNSSLHATPAEGPLRAAARALLAPELARLSWQPAAGEDLTRLDLRAKLIMALADFDDPGVLSVARERFDAVLRGDAGVPPSLRAALLGAAGRNPSEDQFTALLEALRRAERQEERWNYANALAAGRDPVRAQRVLAASIEGRGLPPDVASKLPGLVAQEPSLTLAAYDFSLAQWPRLAALAGTGVFGGRHDLLPAATGESSDLALAARLRKDQARWAGAAGAGLAERAVARIDVRARLRAREADTLAAALAGWQPAPAAAHLLR
jgi:aminopeptidase N